MQSDQDLYRRLRALPGEKLWSDEVPLFDRAPPRERLQKVALIRAVGVAFASTGTPAQKSAVRAWLTGLLRDPAEKIRRYAMAALPKIGAGPGEEKQLLSLLQPTTGEREKKSLGRALEKIGGAATLDAARQNPGLLPQTELKVKASLARAESPSTVRLDRVLTQFRGLRIHLRCRKGLENIVRDEVKDFIAKHGKFHLLEFRGQCVALAPVAPFSLAELFTLRCFDTLAFGLGVVRAPTPPQSVEPLAALLTAPHARRLFETFTEGSFRYRLNFVGKGHQRAAVQLVANRAYALCPALLNDARQAPWTIDLHAIKGGCSVELRPKISPDPRLYFRTDDVWAASHPPLAAGLARVAGRIPREIVWDPFCGSGLELIETALRGGVENLIGTDLDPAALKIAEANLAAAQLPALESHFHCADFRDFEKIPGLGPNSVTLILTNPPMGRRVRVPSLYGLIADLFAIAAQALKPGGRLVFPNPIRLDPSDPSLQLQSRQPIDLGGFTCQLEIYSKIYNNFK
ncbi:MAG: methyltransferase [Opitutales bacterium]